MHEDKDEEDFQICITVPLISDTDKLDINKLETTLTGLIKPRNVGNNEVAKKTLWHRNCGNWKVSISPW